MSSDDVWIERELAETRKFAAEQYKLIAEAQKYERERWWIPITVLAGLLAGNTVIAALVGALVGHFVK